MDHGVKCMQPGLDYFHDKFVDDTKHPMPAFKVASLLIPRSHLPFSPGWLG